jgi:hypothetical protein
MTDETSEEQVADVPAAERTGDHHLAIGETLLLHRHLVRLALEIARATLEGQRRRRHATVDALARAIADQNRGASRFAANRDDLGLSVEDAGAAGQREHGRARDKYAFHGCLTPSSLAARRLAEK